MHLSNKPKGPGWVLVMRTKPPKSTRAKSTQKARKANSANFERNRILYSPLINKAARRYGLNPALVHAVVHTESAYNPKALSHKGAAGLMQLMPATAARFGVTDRYDVEQNVMAGTRYLRWLLDEFNDTSLALAGYNAGEQAVIKYGNKVPPYPETQNYVRKINGLLGKKGLPGKLQAQPGTTQVAGRAKTQAERVAEREQTHQEILEEARQMIRDSLAQSRKIRAAAASN